MANDFEITLDQSFYWKLANHPEVKKALEDLGKSVTDELNSANPKGPRENVQMFDYEVQDEAGRARTQLSIWTTTNHAYRKEARDHVMQNAMESRRNTL